MVFIQLLLINRFILINFILNQKIIICQTARPNARPNARPKKIGLDFCQTKFFGLAQTAICPPQLVTHLKLSDQNTKLIHDPYSPLVTFRPNKANFEQKLK